jgi:hypothetical protein
MGPWGLSWGSSSGSGSCGTAFRGGVSSSSNSGSNCSNSSSNCSNSSSKRFGSGSARAQVGIVFFPHGGEFEFSWGGAHYDIQAALRGISSGVSRELKEKPLFSFPSRIGVPFSIPPTLRDFKRIRFSGLKEILRKECWHQIDMDIGTGYCWATVPGVVPWRAWSDRPSQLVMDTWNSSLGCGRVFQRYQCSNMRVPDRPIFFPLRRSTTNGGNFGRPLLWQKSIRSFHMWTGLFRIYSTILTCHQGSLTHLKCYRRMLT